MRAKDFEKVVKSHRDAWTLVEESCRERNQALLDNLISVYKTRWLQKETQKFMAIKDNRIRDQSGSTERRKSLDGGASIESKRKSIERSNSPLGAYSNRDRAASSVKQLQRETSRKSAESV